MGEDYEVEYWAKALGISRERLAESAVSVEPVREMALKGIRRPMLVHNVIGTATGNPGSS